MVLLEVGSKTPDFSLKNQFNEIVALKNFKGKSNVLVYFYPKASTPGCTVQACGIQVYAEEFERLNTCVVAISPDVPEKLLKFSTKYNLDFNLLSDPDHVIANAYGVWGLKKFMGREFMGIIRTSFLIDKKGCLVKIFNKVNTKTHSDDVIAYIKDII